MGLIGNIVGENNSPVTNRPHPHESHVEDNRGSGMRTGANPPDFQLHRKLRMRPSHNVIVKERVFNFLETFQFAISLITNVLLRDSIQVRLFRKPSETSLPAQVTG